MKALGAALTLLAAMAVCPRGYADDEAQRDRGRVSEGVAERIQDLNLTDEQEAKIAEIRKEFRPKVQESARELADTVKAEEEKIREVLTPEQREKCQAMKAERKEHRMEGLAQRIAHLKELDLTDAEKAQIHEIRNEFHPKIMQAMEGLKGTLTDDQKKNREEALRAGKTHSEVVAALNLTDEQKEKVAGCCKEVRALVKEEMEKLRGVLTEEQQAELPMLKDERRERVRDRLACAIANSHDLSLTDDQKAKIAQIRTEYRPKVHEAGNKLRSAVREELSGILVIIKG
jgi:Spy/CpxP family protein refolding chaperone